MTARILYAVVGPVRYDSDFQGFVMDETGDVIYSHISSSRGWSKVDLAGGVRVALDGDERFPDGYEFVYLQHWTDAPEPVLKAIAERERGQS